MGDLLDKLNQADAMLRKAQAHAITKYLLHFASASGPECVLASVAVLQSLDFWQIYITEGVFLP